MLKNLAQGTPDRSFSNQLSILVELLPGVLAALSLWFYAIVP